MKKVIFLALLSVVAIPAHSATVFIKTGVERVLLSADDEFGGCLMRPTKKFGTSVVNCKNTWVTFDCAGALGGSKSAGQRRLDAAMLAQLTGGEIILRLDDTQKVNGWCLADRVQTIPAS